MNGTVRLPHGGPSRTLEAARHVFIYHPPNGFIVFNNQELPDSPLVDGDLEMVAVRGDEPFASMAWSANCEWYFVIKESGMLLLNVHGGPRALRCRRKTSAFIGLFLDGGLASRSLLRQPRRKAGSTP